MLSEGSARPASRWYWVVRAQERVMGLWAKPLFASRVQWRWLKWYRWAWAPCHMQMCASQPAELLATALCFITPGALWAQPHAFLMEVICKGYVYVCQRDYTASQSLLLPLCVTFEQQQWVNHISVRWWLWRIKSSIRMWNCMTKMQGGHLWQFRRHAYRPPAVRSLTIWCIYKNRNKR